MAFEVRWRVFVLSLCTRLGSSYCHTLRPRLKLRNSHALHPCTAPMSFQPQVVPQSVLWELSRLVWVLVWLSPLLPLTCWSLVMMLPVGALSQRDLMHDAFVNPQPPQHSDKAIVHVCMCACAPASACACNALFDSLGAQFSSLITSEQWVLAIR